MEEFQPLQNIKKKLLNLMKIKLNHLSLLKNIFDNTKLIGKSFEIFIQLLIVLSIVTFSIETLPDLSFEYNHCNDLQFLK